MGPRTRDKEDLPKYSTNVPLLSFSSGNPYKIIALHADKRFPADHYWPLGWIPMARQVRCREHDRLFRDCAGAPLGRDRLSGQDFQPIVRGD